MYINSGELQPRPSGRGDGYCSLASFVIRIGGSSEPQRHVGGSVKLLLSSLSARTLLSGTLTANLTRKPRLLFHIILTLCETRYNENKVSSRVAPFPFSFLLLSTLDERVFDKERAGRATSYCTT